MPMPHAATLFGTKAQGSAMPDLEIKCPHCNRPFKLNETLAAPLIEETRRQCEQEFEEKEEELEERRKAFAEEKKVAEKSRKSLEKERTSLARQKEQLDEQIAEQVE